jgi:hypothetical protein
MPPAPPGAVGAFTTHLVSNTPIETHMFLNLLHRTPIFVGTPDRNLWVVSDGRMIRQ